MHRQQVTILGGAPNPSKRQKPSSSTPVSVLPDTTAAGGDAGSSAGRIRQGAAVLTVLPNGTSGAGQRDHGRAAGRTQQVSLLATSSHFRTAAANFGKRPTLLDSPPAALSHAGLCPAVGARSAVHTDGDRNQHKAAAQELQQAENANAGSSSDPAILNEFEPDLSFLLEDIRLVPQPVYAQVNKHLAEILDDPEGRLLQEHARIVEQALHGVFGAGPLPLPSAGQACDVGWNPPEDGGPATRTHAPVPDLEVSPDGDLVVGTSLWPTFSLGVERDPAIRLSADYADNLPRATTLIMIPPVGFEQDVGLTRRERWEAAHIMMNSVTASTLEGYGLFVVRWLEWCDRKAVPLARRFPACPRLVVSWLMGMFHVYAPAYAAKHLQGIAAWHQVHLLPFDIDAHVRRRIFQGAKAVGRPPQEARRPAMIADLRAVVDYLDEEAEADSKLTPRSAAIKAAFVVGFFAMARCKEVTIKRQLESGRPQPKPKPAPRTVTTRSATRAAARVTAATLGLTQPKKRKRQAKKPPRPFDPKYDPSIKNLSFYQESDDGEQAAMVRIHIPWDKVRKEKGSDIYAAQQTKVGVGLDPVDLMRRHVLANCPAEGEPLFVFEGDRAKRVGLTRSFFARKINEALAAKGRPKLHMHGMRIGGANFYKLAGTDSEVIKSQGRWASSSSYQRYQRQKELTARTITADLHAPEEEGGAVITLDYSSSSDEDEEVEWVDLEDDAPALSEDGESDGETASLL